MKDGNDSELIPGLVSIITPVYNAASYLPLCIGSVLAQSYKHWELVLINDGSTDSSVYICEAFVQQDPRVKVISTRNRGPAAARNIGIAKSQGEFILFLDADDSLESNAVKLLLDSLKESMSDLAIGNFFRVKSQTRKEANPAVIPSRLLTQNDLVSYTRSYLTRPDRHPLFGVAWGRLFKSKIIKRNNLSLDESLSTFEDVAFLFDYLRYVSRACFLETPIYNYMVPYAEQKNYQSACMTIGDNPQKQWGFEVALTHIAYYLETQGLNEDRIYRDIGHAYISFTAIQLVRVCGQLTDQNQQLIKQFVKKLLTRETLRRNLRFYRPKDGPGKIVPFLMRLKLVRLIILVSKRKAAKKYGKLKPKS